ncbi:hypothetical protein SPRG_04628 [Saprolegnia parasitica CBS 223.65]|uniref:Short chain dehydrogenase n=1 Tax=Saprolegnia parasitica (strain CBS 223.65) TaxID=695850 RepID=A0A067CVC4_SAPPC|nr:hypothetical protein SPRG_04628 [Saprolegnia parasitica CBS 223.65]KDO30727.1 hypothetical protein SPRG_04628 [Saprolegnia parasitica CBS 223.65]|eukprot:XP_012198427.1 hypothetical protein SPRG_04628 [Saprolegnia parasitica CBS 223.65]
MAAIKRVLITGASRGIGLELARHYKAKGWLVIAAVRNPATAIELHELGLERIVAMDVIDELSIDAAASTIGPDTPIDLLLNNAGILLGRSLTDATKENLLRQFEVNTVGPFLVTKAFLPNLNAAVKTQGLAIAAYITSKMGSIECNVAGSCYGYRASKTGLNSLIKSLAIELGPKGISTLLLHPGYVQTDMNDMRGELTVAESIAGMAAVLDTAKPGDNAKYYDIDGSILPW